MSNLIEYEDYYFTFGPDHVLPNGHPAKGEYMMISAPTWADARSIAVGVLGNTDFAFQYTAKEWVYRDMERKHYDNKLPAIMVHVVERVSQKLWSVDAIT